MKDLDKKLTWDDLANLYYKKTGFSARARLMNEVLDWAIENNYVKEIEDGCFIRTK